MQRRYSEICDYLVFWESQRGEIARFAWGGGEEEKEVGK